MENWLPVVGYEGLYEVSDLGRVKSLKREVAHWRGGTRTYQEKILKPVLQGGRYYIVSLNREGKLWTPKIHRLVLDAFVGPRPEGMQGCHRDDDKANNALSNVYWGTPRQNADDAKRNGKRPVTNPDACKNGHPWTEESRYVYEDGEWACRICRNISGAKHRAKKRAAQ